MRYDTMDHAGWVERNIAAAKGGLSAADKRRAAQGKGWGAAPDTLNPFQRRAFTLLGIMGSGIYNAPITWKTVEWRPWSIWLTWQGELSTFDWKNLTNGVFLAHDAAIRMAIHPAGMCLRIGLSDRSQGSPLIIGAHPTLEAAFTAHRERFPAGHHIHRTDIAAGAPSHTKEEGND